MKLTLTALLSCFCLSCSMVVSKQPVGSVVADAEKLGLAGTWVGIDLTEEGETENGAGKFAIVVKDAREGRVLMIPSDPEKDTEREFIIRQTGEVVFASFKAKDGEYYAWLEVKVEKDRLRLRMHDFEEFEKLHKQKKLPSKLIVEERISEDGTITRSSRIILDDPPQKWVEQLVAGKFGDPYDNDDADYFKRVD